MKKTFLFLFIALAFLSAFAACGEAVEPTEIDSTAPDTFPTELPEPLPTEPEPQDDFVPDGNVNPLTGLCDGISDQALARRPVAIMVSNSKDSLPQWGISQADIIYEMLAEGRISRFLAIFQEPEKIDKLASIRSSRPYFIDIAQSYGAVYMHFGGSVPAYEAIAARNDLINIDGIKGSWEGTLFYRDAERKKKLGSEHSVYTAGEYMLDAFAKLKSPLELEGSPSAFNFASEHSALGGAKAERVQFTFSSSHRPYFEYNAESGTYLRFQYGEPHMDAWLDRQIEVKNLLILRMKLTDVPGSSLKLVEIETTGEGEGYYFCEGTYVEIIWKKEKNNSPITFYTKDGQELICARGQSFVSVITATADVEIE